MSKKTSEWDSTDKFMELVGLLKQWFKDEEIELGYTHDYVMGRMASRLQRYIQDLLAKEKMELVKRIEEAVCNPDWDRDRSVAGIIIYLKALKSELQEEVGG